MPELQLSLFKGKRQRGKRPPPPLEFASHVVIADMLRRWCNPAWEWTHLPMGEKRHIGTAMKLKRMGVRPGWPDFLFAGPDRQLVWLELKRQGRRNQKANGASDEQDSIGQHLRDCGFDYLLTDSVSEAERFLKRFGILPATITSFGA
jgi:hypothetical protein